MACNLLTFVLHPLNAQLIFSTLFLTSCPPAPPPLSTLPPNLNPDPTLYLRPPPPCPDDTLTTYNPVPPAVVRSAVKNIQVFNPTTNTLNVRWEPATGQVLQYRVVYSPVTGARPSESVSFSNFETKHSYALQVCSNFCVSMASLLCENLLLHSSQNDGNSASVKVGDEKIRNGSPNGRDCESMLTLYQQAS